MMERQCGRCRFFSAARSCMEKPTWGHCLYGVHEGGDCTEAEGRFTWANKTCEHFKVREGVSVFR